MAGPNESKAEQTGPAQAPPAAGAQRQVRLRMDESHLSANYANAFRTYTTPEEVIVDFGLNLVVQLPRPDAADGQPAGELLFQLNDRVIMNYQTAKRLAITVGQVVRRYEDQFGEIKLNPAERVKGG